MGIGLIVIAGAVYAYSVHDEASSWFESTSIATSTQESSNTKAVTVKEDKTNTHVPAAIAGEYVRTRDDGTISGTITVTQKGPNTVHIKGEAYWGSAPNYGDIDTDAPLVNNTIHYIEGKGNSVCAVDFVFSGRSVDATVLNSNGCDWGVNVDFSGHYVRK